MCRVVEVSEPPVGIGCPDQVVRRFHQIAVTVLTFEQELDDAALLCKRSLDGGEFLRRLLRVAVQCRRRKAIDQLLGITPVPALRAYGDEDTLFVPAAQFLDRDAETLGRFLYAVFGFSGGHAALSGGRKV